MITLCEPAYAKINLTLDVLEKRKDGYHDLISVMQTVSLHDDIQLTLTAEGDWQLSCDRPGIPEDERNLAWKAAQVFFAHRSMKVPGLTIRIRKRIPSQAGLGGGSADAAAVLRGLNRLHDFPYSKKELEKLGEQIGSDVPFCVRGATALAEGRGERLTPLEKGLDCFVVICKPERSFSTPELFHRLDGVTLRERPRTAEMRKALEQGSVQQIGSLLSNVFEQAALPIYPELEPIKERLRQEGAQGACMTGSGSAIYGIFAQGERARDACAALKSQYPMTFFAQTV